MFLFQTIRKHHIPLSELLSKKQSRLLIPVPSDVDILVKIDQRISLLRFIAIQQELEDALGMKVDLVEYDALKPALKSDILKEEVTVL